jgi:sigma-B regulation protein RsbU (phosphoserine phosphatase)
MVRAFIVDDEPPARVRLRQLLDELGDVLVVGEAGDAVEARDSIAEARPDVVFLDIEMPEVSGTDLAATLPEPRPFVVFATAFERYALAAFAVDATDYLVKPITRARLSGTLDRVRDRLSRRSDLERDLEAASAAQAMLQRRALPTIPGYDAAAVTIPARGVGGDFFIGQPIDAKRFALALGDVSGKGMPAGIVASSLQARIEAVAHHGRGNASSVVADINEALWNSTGAGRFATLVYAELDIERSRLTIVNAGHLPPIVLRPGGEPLLIGSTGPALGLTSQTTFDAVTVDFPPKALTLFYSDGVTESMDADDHEFDQSRLIDCLRSHQGEPAARICETILAAVRAHTGPKRAHDDLTVLAIRKRSSP